MITTSYDVNKVLSLRFHSINNYVSSLISSHNKFTIWRPFIPEVIPPIHLIRIWFVYEIKPNIIKINKWLARILEWIFVRDGLVNVDSCIFKSCLNSISLVCEGR